jgi:trk system potassium uptake protein TrkA
MKKSRLDIAVIGLGTFGYELAVQLSKKGHHILAVDIDEKKVNDIKDEVDLAVAADITDEDVIKKLELADFDKIVFAMTSALESIILAITTLKKLNAKYIIGKANTRIKKEILLKIGADEVILPEISTAIRLAERLSEPDVLEKFRIDDENALIEIKTPRKFRGKTLRELDLRKKHGLSVIFIRRNGKTGIADPEMPLKEDDILYIVGNEEEIKDFFID